MNTDHLTEVPELPVSRIIDIERKASIITARRMSVFIEVCHYSTIQEMSSGTQVVTKKYKAIGFPEQNRNHLHSKHPTLSSRLNHLSVY